MGPSNEDLDAVIANEEAIGDEGAGIGENMTENKNALLADDVNDDDNDDDVLKDLAVTPGI